MYRALKKNERTYFSIHVMLINISHTRSLHKAILSIFFFFLYLCIFKYACMYILLF